MLGTLDITTLDALCNILIVSNSDNLVELVQGRVGTTTESLQRILPYEKYTSATTLISVWNTRVFRMALTALTEPRTLWRRITRYTSHRRRVALHTYLLYFAVTYMHHQNDTGVTLFAGAAAMQKPFTQRLAIDNKPGSTWERRRHVWEHLESQSCIQFVFSSMYLCIYIATLLHTLYLDWLRSAEYILPVTLSTSITPVSPYNRRRSLKICLIERVWDALGDGDRVNSEMHLEAVIVRDWTSTWRRSMDGAPRLYSSVS